jgi:D-alanine-D-alanine ligase
VLAVLEVSLLGGAEPGVYSYRNKEECEELVEYRLLDKGPLHARLATLALAAWRAIGCRDAGRVDFRLDASGEPHVLEINPLAGMHPDHSDLPIMAKLCGVPYVELIGRILRSAMARIEGARRSKAA